MKKQSTLYSQVQLYRKMYKSGMISRNQSLKAIQESVKDYIEEKIKAQNEEFARDAEFEDYKQNGPMPEGGEL